MWDICMYVRAYNAKWHNAGLNVLIASSLNWYKNKTWLGLNTTHQINEYQASLVMTHYLYIILKLYLIYYLKILLDYPQPQKERNTEHLWRYDVHVVSSFNILTFKYIGNLWFCYLKVPNYGILPLVQQQVDQSLSILLGNMNNKTFSQWHSCNSDKGISTFASALNSPSAQWLHSIGKEKMTGTYNMNNRSSVTVFSLSGFSATVTYRNTLFSLTLLCYFLILVVNVSLISTIILCKNLHEPMYIFLCSLCINGLYGTAGFYPKFAFDLLSDVHVVSYVGCFLQVFVIYSNAKIDYSILVVMAYDRYVAICRPLEYHAVMSVRRTAVLVGLSWLVPLCCESIVILLTSMLKLCGSHIDKIYCENWSIVKLACGPTKVNNIVGLIIIAFYCCHVLFIACSYVWLVKSCLKSREGRRKFMRTCVPHLLCLLNVTASLLFDVTYSRYGSVSVPQNLRNFMAIQFLIITPTLNPLIYGLNLTKIRGTMKGFICAWYQVSFSFWLYVAMCHVLHVTESK